MRLLDRYLLRELLIPFGYCLFGFLIFWVSFDIFGELATFQKLKLTPLDVLTYYGIKTPETLVLIMPIAFLLALLYSLTNHARYNEITAIRAAGVSLFRLSLPYLAVGLLLSLVVFAMNELWVPQSLEASDEILARHQTGKPRAGPRQTEENLVFYNSGERRWWIIESFQLATAAMLRPTVIWLRPDGSRMDLHAQGATYDNGVWVFTNVQAIVYSAEQPMVAEPGQQPSIAMAAFKETPEQIRSEVKIRKITDFKTARKAQLSVREILEYMRLHPGDHPKRGMLQTKLHGRLAAPWTCFVVVLMALPFGAASGRRNVFVGVASSILICFAYFVLQQLALALGSGGYLPPWVAAWSPNAVFVVTGLALTARVR